MALNLEAFNNLTGVETDPDETIVQRLRFDDALEIPHQLTDVDVWCNYCNDDLYYLDKAVREHIKKSQWTRLTKGHMKTAVPLVFLAIFGRAAEPGDSQTCVMLHRLLKYYCTRYTGSSKILGKRFTRVYYFSKYAMRSKRPLSIRLRLEETNNESSFREYRANEDKRAKRRPGVTAHGPLADGDGSISE